MNHILSQNHGRKIAIIVNEFGEINIDSKLVRHTTEKMIQMSNGCICCTLRDDLLQELQTLSQMPDLEYILIESPGIGEPMPIAQTFYMGGLEDELRLDSIITVVDALNFGRPTTVKANGWTKMARPLLSRLRRCWWINLNLPTLYWSIKRTWKTREDVSNLETSCKN
ncbi:GTP-binding protein [Candidatus Villigracilis vicinus]|uniref:CobW family GTP-binding protein n=1 Tax=Candidatus Villigracilis vicinus TaxID=3140679 RepID=UPI0031E6C281